MLTVFRAVEAIDRTGVGKINKVAMREKYLDGGRRAAAPPPSPPPPLLPPLPPSPPPPPPGRRRPPPLPPGAAALQLVGELLQEQADVGDDAEGLEAAAVGELGDHRRVDVHADGVHRGRQQVAGGDGVQHGGEHEAGAGPLGVRAHGACASMTSVITSGMGPSSRMEPASTKGVPVFTSVYMRPLVSTPCSTAASMPPQRGWC